MVTTQPDDMLITWSSVAAFTAVVIIIFEVVAGRNKEFFENLKDLQKYYLFMEIELIAAVWILLLSALVMWLHA